MLAFAAAQIDADVFGAFTDEAHMWLTAHKLVSDPTGREARIKNLENRSPYLVEYERLVALVAPFQVGLVP